MESAQRQQLLKELFDHATESIVVINHTGQIVMANPATERLFGYSQIELSEKKVEALMPDRFAQKHVSHRDGFNTNPHSRKMGLGMDLYARKKDNSEFPVEISLSPFKSDNGMFTIAFIVDISRRKEVEEQVIRDQKKLEALTLELKSSNEKLEAKVRDRTKVLQEALTTIEKSRAELSEALEKEKELNELKSRFLSMASHEFRTPLTTILSSASLIPDYPLTEQQEKRLRHVERIRSAVSNLNDILGDFLSLSKIEEGKVSADFKLFNLKTLIEELCGELKGIAKAGQEMLYTHEGEVQVTLDPKLIRNVLINLISNALKFSDENKKVFIQTKTGIASVEIIVRDQGIGISNEDREHLFERFFRGNNATNIQGTGLGLNIVSKYVDLMNGKINVHSELNKGTTFTLLFNS